MEVRWRQLGTARWAPPGPPPPGPNEEAAATDGAALALSRLTIMRPSRSPTLVRGQLSTFSGSASCGGGGGGGGGGGANAGRVRQAQPRAACSPPPRPSASLAACPALCPHAPSCVHMRSRLPPAPAPQRAPPARSAPPGWHPALPPLASAAAAGTGSRGSGRVGGQRACHLLRWRWGQAAFSFFLFFLFSFFQFCFPPTRPPTCMAASTSGSPVSGIQLMAWAGGRRWEGTTSPLNPSMNWGWGRGRGEQRR